MKNKKLFILLIVFIICFIEIYSYVNVTLTESKKDRGFFLYLSGANINSIRKKQDNTGSFIIQVDRQMQEENYILDSYNIEMTKINNTIIISFGNRVKDFKKLSNRKVLFLEININSNHISGLVKELKNKGFMIKRKSQRNNNIYYYLVSSNFNFEGWINKKNIPKFLKQYAKYSKYRYKVGSKKRYLKLFNGKVIKLSNNIRYRILSTKNGKKLIELYDGTQGYLFKRKIKDRYNEKISSKNKYLVIGNQKEKLKINTRYKIISNKGKEKFIETSKGRRGFLVTISKSKQKKKKHKTKKENKIDPNNLDIRDKIVYWAENLKFEESKYANKTYDIFVKKVYKKAGISIENNIEVQKDEAKKKNMSELKKGDLIFFSRESSLISNLLDLVAIYEGNKKFIYYSPTQDKKLIGDLNDKKWDQAFVTGGSYVN